uniref:CRM domain-containing protein n=1 Tax=Cannabis sativa TaxID=3483 RepID=A0A803QF73_CANSA
MMMSSATSLELNCQSDVVRFSLVDNSKNNKPQHQQPKFKRRKMSKKAKVNQLKFYRLMARKKINSPNPEVRIRYKLEKAKRKETWLIDKLRNLELPKTPHETEPHDPEALTEEEKHYIKRTGEKKKNYVPVGRRGVFGGVVLNMHLHWKKHETVKVVCRPCKPDQLQEYAQDLARLSKGIIIDIKHDNTILFYRGKNYVQPTVMSPPTISKEKALEKYKFLQSLEHTSQFIEKLEKELEEYQEHLARLDKGVELDYHWIEFDDVRFHIQVSVKNPHHVLLSVSLPTPPPETAFVGGLPLGALEAIKIAYSGFVQVLDPPRDGFNLTLKLNLSKLPPDEEYKHAILIKIASVREVVLGAPLRLILKGLGSRMSASNIDRLVALVHRSKESFFLLPQAEKVTVVFPMRFKDSVDIVLATSFLQEFVEARRAAGLNNAPLCLWSPTPPLELKGAPAESLSANAGFITIVIFPRHVEGKKLDRTVWSLSTFHAYVSYHVKCSEGFMHTRMRRRVESLIQALDRAKPGSEDSKKAGGNNASFRRLSLKEGRASWK